MKFDEFFCPVFLGFTPWFDAWTKLYLQSVPCAEHEFLRHHLGCVFVTSSNTKEDPIEQLNNLVQTQRKLQHEKSGSGLKKIDIIFFYSNFLSETLLFYVVKLVFERRCHLYAIFFRIVV